MTKLEVLSISEKEVSSLITMDDVLEVVELAFSELARGYAQMPPKVYLNFREHHGDLRTMPAYLERLNISAVKVANVHPNNPEKFGMPAVMATLLLIDPKNGKPLAIMGGRTITSMRTGAAGGIAAKNLAIRDPKSVSFIGAGIQARSQLSALLLIFPSLQEIRVWDIRSAASNEFAEEIKRKANKLLTLPAETAKDAVEGADIVVTTTPSTRPLILNDWVANGTHFNCMGADAPGKQELEPSILRRAKIVVDDWVQAAHSGEINVPVSQGILFKENIWAELGEIVAGTRVGRSSPNEITVFDSTGLAVQDAVTAELIYRRALERKVGSHIDI